MHGRSLRVALAVVGALALPASASAATPSKFITSKQGDVEPLAARGSSGTGGEQALHLAPFDVSCRVARSTGGPSPGYTELRDDVKLSRCTTSVEAQGQPVTVPAKVKGVMDLFHKGNGNAELVNPFLVIVPSLKCTISIDEGTELRNALVNSEGELVDPYENVTVPTRRLHAFPSGYQRKLAIHNALLGLTYSFSGGCASLTPSEGAYSGTTAEEAVGGDLEFVPGPEEWNLIENKEV
jgi:hypothetical protein